MSTFLQLAQAVAREVGASGSGGPTAVTGQTGELNRIVNWVADYWTELQAAKRQWRWMRSEFSLSTTSGDDNYSYGDCTDSIASATIARFSHWIPGTFRIYLTSAGVGTQHYLIDVSWDEFQRLWKTGSQTNGYPSMIAIDPRDKLRLGAVPDAAYTVIGDYQKSPQTLSANSDEPEMPAKYHRLIVYGAMEKYAGYQGAPEVWTRVKNEAKALKLALEADQLPAPGFGPPLA